MCGEEAIERLAVSGGLAEQKENYDSVLTAHLLVDAVCTHSMYTQYVHTVCTHSMYTQYVHTVCTHSMYTQYVHTVCTQS